MSDIRLQSITVHANPLVIRGYPVSINDTTSSTDSATGALTVAGGAGISSTTDSTNYNNGGALTIAGGVGIAKNTRLGSGLYLENVSGIVSVAGLTNPRFKIDNITNKKITFAPNGDDLRFEINNDYISSSSTQGALNSTTASFILSGGIGINSSVGTTSLNATGDLRTSNDIYSKSIISSSSCSLGNFIIDSANSRAGLNTIPTSCLDILLSPSATRIFFNIDGGLPSLGIFDTTGTNATSFKFLSKDFSMTSTNANASINFTNTSGNKLLNFSPSGSFIYSGNFTLSSGNSLIALSSSNTIGKLYTLNDNIGINNVNPTVALDVSGNTLLNNLTTIGQCFISMSSILNGTTTIASLFVSSNSILNNSTINSLFVSTNSIFNGFNTFGSIWVTGNSNLRGFTSFGSTINGIDAIFSSTVNADSGFNCEVSANSNIKGNTTLGNIFVSGNSILNGFNTLGGLAVTGNSIFNGFNTLGGLAVTGNSIFNGFNTLGGLAVTGNSILNGVNTLGSVAITNNLICNRSTISTINTNFITTSNIYVTEQLSFFEAALTNPDSYQMGLSGVDIRVIGAYDQDTVRSYDFGSYDGDNSANSWSSTLLVQTCSRGNIFVKNNLSSGSLTTSLATITNLKTSSVDIYGVTSSVSPYTGALHVAGGTGIEGNLNVLGDTTITGNLNVYGTISNINSTNTVLTDNIILLNSGVGGTKDSAVLIQRFQSANDSGLGDVVNDSIYTTDTLPVQGVSSTEIKLSSSASSVNNFYTGWWVKVISGFSNNQVRRIVSYVGSTRLATIETAWTTQNPGTADTVQLYNSPFVGLSYNETTDGFELGGTSYGSTSANLSMQRYFPLYVSRLFVNSIEMTPSTGDFLTTQTFNASNNVSSMTDITGLSFSNTLYGFNLYIVVVTTASPNYYQNFHIKGIFKNTSWQIDKQYVGDNSGVDFSITNSGQLQYTSPNFSGFSSLVFKYKATTI